MVTMKIKVFSGGLLRALRAFCNRQSSSKDKGKLSCLGRKELTTPFLPSCGQNALWPALTFPVPLAGIPSRASYWGNLPACIFPRCVSLSGTLECVPHGLLQKDSSERESCCTAVWEEEVLLVWTLLCPVLGWHPCLFHSALYLPFACCIQPFS